MLIFGVDCQRRFDFVVFRRLKNAGKQWCGNVEKLGLSLLKEGIDGYESSLLRQAVIRSAHSAAFWFAFNVCNR